MKKRKVIKGDNLPMRSPLLFTLVQWLILDRCNSPGWVWGAIGVILVFLWIGWVIELFRVETVDILKNE